MESKNESSSGCFTETSIIWTSLQIVTSLATLGNFICIDANLGFGNDDFLFVYGNDPNPDPMVHTLKFSSSGSILLNQEVSALSEHLKFGIEALEQ